MVDEGTRDIDVATLAGEALPWSPRTDRRNSAAPCLDAVLLPRPAPYHRCNPWPAIARCTSVVLFAGGLAIAAFALDYPDHAEAVSLNATALLLALGFVASDLSRMKSGGVTAITAFS